MFEPKLKNFNKKIATLFVVITLLSSFSPLTARKAEAFIFTDWVNFAVNAITSAGTHALWIKEYALDAVAGQVMNLVIQRITASTVNWINSGFKGSPAFVTNPEAFFADIGDKAAGQYIFKDPNLNFLCGPIRAKIRITLAGAYNRGRDQTRWQCTLTKVGKNLDNFMADFDNGGWENFFELTQRPQNNPIGAYIQAEGELFERLAQKQDIAKTDLLQGRGFLSFKTCEKWSAPTQDDNGNVAPVCIEEGIATPGSVIETKLNNTLSIGNQKLAVADEINEIVSALLNQVAERIVGGIGGGLRSLSRPDPSSGNQVFTSQLSPTTDDTKINQYFTQSAQNTNNILNLPPYDAATCRNNPTLPECLPPPGDPANCDPSTDPNCQTP